LLIVKLGERRGCGMPRARKAPDEKAPTPLIAPAMLIDAHAVYRAAAVQAALGFGSRALRAEWRAGRLRIVRRCNRNFIIGKDLLNWLDSGELLSPSKRHHANGAALN
jgi:hypothetical protein